MSYPSVSNTFVNGDDIDATALNTNFSDLVNALRDGDLDFNMNDATLTGSLIVTSNLDVAGNLQDSSGNIGVNTTNPTEALYVDGSAYVSGDIVSYPTTGGWYDASGLYTIRGFASYDSYTYKHKRVGRMNYVGFYLDGPLDGTAVTIGLPTECYDNGFDWQGSFQVLEDVAGAQTTPGRWLIPAGTQDATLFHDYATEAWGTDQTGRRVNGVLRYEE